MVDKRCYDFTDSDEETTPPESSRRRNKRKATTTTLANYSGPSPKMTWSENDELRILKGIVEYRNERGVDYVTDLVAFYNYVKDGMSSEFSKDQLKWKISKLKTKFSDNSVKVNPSFKKPHDAEVFRLSMPIWGKDKAVDGNMTKKSKVQGFVQHEAGTSAEPKSKSKVVDIVQHEAMITGEPEDDDAEPEDDDGDDSGKDDSCDIKHVTNETFVNENAEGDAEDERCAIEDAFEASMLMIPQSSKYAEKRMLRNLRNLPAAQRKELSDEWKALLVEQMQMMSKTQGFGVKLATAAMDTQLPPLFLSFGRLCCTIKSLTYNCRFL